MPDESGGDMLYQLADLDPNQQLGQEDILVSDHWASTDVLASLPICAASPNEPFNS
jgi:hypothetical protein